MIDRIARNVPDVANGLLRMSTAAVSDLAHALDLLHVLDGDAPTDPLDARDPDYIRDTLPALRMLSEVYFRADVRGLENIPSDEPVLLVGNHSGGTHIADTYVFAQAFYDHFGPNRLFHQLAHDLVFKAAGLRVLATKYGTVPASPENMKSALQRGAALLVYPGGDHETFRPSWESDQIDFGGRKGFARLSLELDTPIVPVVAIGGQETALFLGQGHGLAKALRLDRIARLKVLPAQIGPPYGITVLDLPGRVALPAKITVRVLPRIDLRERLGEDATPEAAYELVTEAMQDALSELADERALPVVG